MTISTPLYLYFFADDIESIFARKIEKIALSAAFPSVPCERAAEKIITLIEEKKTLAFAYKRIAGVVMTFTPAERDILHNIARDALRLPRQSDDARRRHCVEVKFRRRAAAAHLEAAIAPALDILRYIIKGGLQSGN